MGFADMYIDTIIFSDFRIAPRRGEVLDGILPIPFRAPHLYP